MPQAGDSEAYWSGVRDDLGLPATVGLDLLRQAFCHASFSREQGLPASASNQRLEFLGDAVLDLIVVEHFYRAHADVPEGQLTKMKATAVRSQSLFRLARQLNLGAHMLLGRGEEETGGRQKPSLLADCCEALVGAVYLSTGLETTRRFRAGHLQHSFCRRSRRRRRSLTTRRPCRSFAGEDQSGRRLQKRWEALGPTPMPERSWSRCLHNGTAIGRGEGQSKQSANRRRPGPRWTKRAPGCLSHSTTSSASDDAFGRARASALLTPPVTYAIFVPREKGRIAALHRPSRPPQKPFP